ncbi:MAG: extracellular solute-binding protein, partial [Armatimonadetes bacterium]|nr:extracellular solute-binding protein [Armatimonadota bacterium]
MPTGSHTVTRRGFVTAACACACAGEAEAAPQARISLATVSANYKEGFEQVARGYEKLHPGTSAVVQVMPANGYETWLRTQIPGGGSGAPDLFNANYAWGMYEKGLMVNLSPYLQRRNPYTGKPWIETLNTQFIE